MNPIVKIIDLVTLLPLPLSLLCNDYLFEKWCIKHDEIYMGKQCSLCITKDELKNTQKHYSLENLWTVMEDMPIVKDVKRCSGTIQNGLKTHSCFVPTHVDDLKVCKEWSKFLKNTKNIKGKCGFHNVENHFFIRWIFKIPSVSKLHSPPCIPKGTILSFVYTSKTYPEYTTAIWARHL